MSDYDIPKGPQKEYTKLAKKFKPVTQLLAGSTKEIGSRLIDIDNKIPHNTIKRIGQGAIETIEDVKWFKMAMVEFGYPPHEKMGIQAIKNIAQSYRNKDESLINSIDDMMCVYYNSQTMLEIAKSWEDNPRIKDRLPILRNVIMAHNQGMYNVAIPTVMSQFEGVLVDSFQIEGHVNGGKIKFILQKLLHNNSQISFDQEIYNYYEENILVGFEHGKIVNSDISRNAILHGADREYGTQTNSIKLILLFDYIARRVNDIDNDDVYRVNNPY